LGAAALILGALACPSALQAQGANPDSLFHSTRGIGVGVAPGAQFDLVSLPDGAGGAYLAWVDDRSGGDDIYVQRIGANGRPAAGWTPSGVAVCRAARGQYAPRLASDGKGGVFVAWEDLRGGSPGVFVQHVSANGQRNGVWPPDGTPACSAEFPQRTPDLIADGAGGVIVAWQDHRGPTPAIYVQRIAGDATIEVGWPTNGVAIAGAPGVQALPRLVSDAVNGAIVLWEDSRSGTAAAYAHRITWRGRRADSWPFYGLALSPTIGRQDLVRGSADGAGGAYVAWRDHRRGTPDLFILRVQGDGDVHTSWPATGVTLSSFPSGKGGLQIAPDGAGGVFASWEDERSGSGANLYMQRVDATGRRLSGWPSDGRALSTAAGFQVASSIATDGAGGVYGVWQDFREGQSHVYGQYLTPGGGVGPGWPAAGLRLASDAAGQVGPRATPDGAGGVIVAWEQGFDDSDLFAARVGPTGLGAAAVQLFATDVERTRVRVTWRAQAGASFELIPQKRREDTGWADLATRVPAADGMIELEDTDVVPDTRYGYRLARLGAGGREHFGEVWVQTPAAPVLALAGMVPNPARGDLMISFSLPASGGGSLDLYDVAGRRVRSRDLATLGPGRHTIDLAAGAPVPPGFYLVRLEYAGRILTARGTVIR
jgi:hypothetical protein